jgi:cytochrome c oxidase subunit 2
MIPDLPLFPEAASSLASEVDHLYLAWLGISLFFSLLIALLIVIFFMKFRQRNAQPVGEDLHISTLPLEIGWTVIPLLIVLGMFAWGTKVFFDLSRPPRDAVDYFASGKQWMWKFQHPEGVRETNDLHVPVGQAVRLTMTSQDVIHSFYVPAFRVKADVVPGRYSTVWFRPIKPGEYHLFCAEYCGTEHSRMRGTVHVMEPDDYEEWLTRGQQGSPVRVSGRQLFERLACDTCHRDGGSTGLPERAPQLAGLLGRRVELQGGRSVVADDSYIRESILDPQAKIVAGWQPIMPTYRGQMTEEEMFELLAYLRGLQDPEPAMARLGAAAGDSAEPGDTAPQGFSTSDTP